MSKKTKAAKKSQNAKKETAKKKRILDLSNVAQSVNKLTQIADMKKSQQKKAVSLIETEHSTQIKSNLKAKGRKLETVVDSDKIVTWEKLSKAHFPKKKMTIHSLDLLAAFSACGFIDNVVDDKRQSVKGFTLDTIAKAGSKKLDWDYDTIVQSGYSMSACPFFKYFFDKLYQARTISGVYYGASCIIPLGKRIVGANGGYAISSTFKKAFFERVAKHLNKGVDWVGFTQMFGKHRICK